MEGNRNEADGAGEAAEAKWGKAEEPKYEGDEALK